MNYKDDLYIDVLKERAKKIQEKKSEIERLKGSKKQSKRDIIELNGLEEELKKINSYISSYTGGGYISPLDESTIDSVDTLNEKKEKKSKKKESYQEKVERLEELKNKLKLLSSKRIVNKKIEKIQKKIEILNSKEVKIANKQRKKIYSNLKAQFKRNAILSKQKARVQYVEDQINDNDLMRKAIDINTFSGVFKAAVYDIRGIKYQKNLEKEKEIYEKMKSSDVTLVGSRVISVVKKRLEQLRNRIGEREMAHAM